MKFKFDDVAPNLQELEEVDTKKKGKADAEESKPFDQFKGKKSTYKDEIYSTKLPDVITKAMEKKGKRLELEIGQGRDEESGIKLADETSTPKENVEEKLFAAASATEQAKARQESTPKHRKQEPAK